MREHNISNTVSDLQKKRLNHSIQPYKITQHTSTSLLDNAVGSREEAVCVQREITFTVLFYFIHFCKAEAFILWMVLEAQPPSL